MMSLYVLLIEPKSTNTEVSRKEFILNTLLIGCIILTFTAFLENVIYAFFLRPHSYQGINPGITFIFLLYFCLLLVISRLRRTRLSAVLFIAFLFLCVTYTSLQWGEDLPQVLLLDTLLIIMAGILVSKRFIITTTTLLTLMIFTTAFLHEHHLYPLNSYWRKELNTTGDTVVLLVTFFIIALVSWLANREIEKALKRALDSEEALKKERDMLEIMVEKRTQELQHVQLEQISQLYRFAEFGRLASGLFHDIVNPLSLVSLNLERLQKQSKHLTSSNLQEVETVLKRASDGTKQLERFIEVARRQIQHQDIKQEFFLREEIEHIIPMLSYKAKKAHVKIHIKAPEEIPYVGNVVQFQQILLNLLVNAIDAYDMSAEKKKNQVILISLARTDSQVIIQVQDFGIGISPQQMGKIFNPFFTTKAQGKGMGIGLTVTKKIVEKQFNGSIAVTSSSEQGTVFVIALPYIETRYDKALSKS